MSSLLEHYKVLGVSVGAGIADVTSSYKRLCRLYHPDISSDPESEEQMKRINIAYSALRDKLRREAAFRDRNAYMRQARRYPGADARTYGSEARKANTEAEKDAYAVLHDYFKAINAFDYSGAYKYLSNYDKRHISLESFIEWRKSVSRLYPMREFNIRGGNAASSVTFNDGKAISARRFRVAITEENFDEGATHSGDVEKLVINENGLWKVFLGYSSVADLTKAFDERFEAKWKRDIAKRWEDYYSSLYPEYNMLCLSGMRKAMSREMYRQKRFGGAMTFAAISIKAGGVKGAGQEELLRSAAKTICGALRETDISAYVGDGVFAMLLVELRKKNAEDIVSRLADKIRKNAGPLLGMKAEIKYTFESWSGSSHADVEAVNRILTKFHKKV